MASPKITRDLYSLRPWSAIIESTDCLTMRLDVPGLWYNRYGHNKQKCICSTFIWYACCRRESTRIGPTSAMPAWTRSLWDIGHSHKMKVKSNLANILVLHLEKKVIMILQHNNHTHPKKWRVLGDKYYSLHSENASREQCTSWYCIGYIKSNQ